MRGTYPMRLPIACATLALVLTLTVVAPLALTGCMSKAKRHLYRAEDMFEKRDLTGAQKELQEAIKDDPNLLDAHKSLAVVDEFLGDTAGAAKEYDIVSRLDPTDQKALSKARYYRQLQEMANAVDDAVGEIKAGKIDEGLSALRDALTHSPSKTVRDKALDGLRRGAPMITQQADQLAQDKKYDDAIKTYDSAVRAYMMIVEATKKPLDPACDKILHSANEAALAMGAPDRTFRLLNDVLAIDPDSKTANMELAQLYLRHHPPDYETAADLMERAGAPDAEVAKLRAKAKHLHH
jgi:Tfp pilus assembly protein PilF